MVSWNQEKYYLKNMYNMEVSIGSYKFRLEIILLIVVVSWILWGHLLCSCSNVSLKEGLDVMVGANGGAPSKKPMAMPSTMSSSAMPMPAATGSTSATMAATMKEGFLSANNVASGPEFAGAKTPDYIMNPSTWSMPTLVYSPGTAPDAGVKAIWNRPKQPIPLPEGELDMFATTPFAPECCPNAYSSSTGCACMTVGQYQNLLERSGNNVPYSVY